MTANQLQAVRNYETARNNRELERLRELELEETKNHNRISETELRRHQLATENISRGELFERERSNRANESIGRTNASANVMNAYSNRSNAQTNRLNAYTNQTNAYSNRLNSLANLTNASTNIVQAGVSAGNLREQSRHNKAVEEETVRYQTAMNDIARQKNVIEERNTAIRKQDADTNRNRLNIERWRAFGDVASTIMNGAFKVAGGAKTTAK